MAYTWQVSCGDVLRTVVPRLDFCCVNVLNTAIVETYLNILVDL